ncbi:MAG: hypothetical protein JW936_06130, partial [Sedimentisphaerales bacterium]|nr:hypothetical protein [Sedimentisphaerales bacterium]
MLVVRAEYDVEPERAVELVWFLGVEQALEEANSLGGERAVRGEFLDVAARVHGGVHVHDFPVVVRVRGGVHVHGLPAAVRVRGGVHVHGLPA